MRNLPFHANRMIELRMAETQLLPTISPVHRDAFGKKHSTVYHEMESNLFIYSLLTVCWSNRNTAGIEAGAIVAPGGKMLPR